MSYSTPMRSRLFFRSACGVMLIAFIALYFPILVMLTDSFLETSPATGASVVTLKWYQLALSDTRVLESLGNSLWIASWTTLASVVIGTAAALPLQRSRFKAKGAIEGLAYVPLIMPEIVMGLSLLIWFSMLGIHLGPSCVILAHITFSLSYVILTVRGRLENFDPAIEEAARDLGATAWQTFWKVTFPLIWPGVLSGALIAFTLSFDDFLITFFTAGIGSDTLPVRIYSMIKFGITPEIHALSSLMIAATALLILFFRRTEPK
ncbi:MAG: ABC transporter permease [Oligoflexia bacterium]|nr:ABC transporter permease [Oligoflexia bacterium]